MKKLILLGFSIIAMSVNLGLTLKDGPHKGGNIPGPSHHIHHVSYNLQKYTDIANKNTSTSDAATKYWNFGGANQQYFICVINSIDPNVISKDSQSSFDVLSRVLMGDGSDDVSQATDLTGQNADSFISLDHPQLITMTFYSSNSMFAVESSLATHPSINEFSTQTTVKAKQNSLIVVNYSGIPSKNQQTGWDDNPNVTTTNITLDPSTNNSSSASLWNSIYSDAKKIDKKHNPTPYDLDKVLLDNFSNSTKVNVSSTGNSVGTIQFYNHMQFYM